MVLESLVNPFQAKKNPLEMFFIGALYSSVAIFLSNWIFREQASLIMVFLTVIACVPFIYHTIKLEEEQESSLDGQKKILSEHYKTLKAFLFLFLGFVLSYSFWYIILPSSLVQSTFRVQSITIQSVNLQIQGGFSNVSTFTQILLNNVKVLIFCVLFAFLYGVGAIFILTWNASVISTAIGNFIRTNLAFYAQKAGFEKIAAYLQIISLGLLRYLLHGIPEILAYFVAGLAGSIISVAVIKEHFGTKQFEKIVLDSSDLILIAVLILVIAALLEVFVTPALF